MIAKVFFSLYGLFAYLIALWGQVWFILYIGDWDFLSSDIHTAQQTSTSSAIMIDTLLILLFALQHSIMARSWFKDWLTRIVPEPIERSTYVLFSGIAFFLICLFWQPIDGTLWHANSTITWWILTAGYLFGWIFSVFATFIINHFELFGLQQVYLYATDKTTPTNAFQEKLLYRFIRHPIQLGVLLGIWITPYMTYGHLLMATLFSMYIMIGLYFEEKDLEKELGEVYTRYKERVGFMLPKRA